MSDRAALATWQQALNLVSAKGIPHENREGIEMLIYETERLTIAYTPAKDERPNGLDIWRPGNWRVGDSQAFGLVNQHLSQDQRQPAREPRGHRGIVSSVQITSSTLRFACC